MRQRRLKGIEEKIAAYADLTLQTFRTPIHPAFSLDIERPEADPFISIGQSGDFPVRWYQRTSPRYILPEGYGRVYVELGCGRGYFINKMAEEDPEALYIGVEGCKTIIVKAMAKTRTVGYKNIRYIDAFINDARSAFGEESLDGVFLNFSDPWPKDRHADRRLSTPEKAAAYLRVLRPGGMAVFKTDSEAFFKYSLASFAEAGFQIIGCACELATGVPFAAVADRAVATPTEYEQRFRSLGQPIYHFKALRLK